jgi:hypothetical protein
MLAVVPRRALTLRTCFEPTRLGREYLRLAYEVVVPIRQVRVRQAAAEVETEPHQSLERRKGEGA